MSRVGRNEPCPCGSGKKYKRCCLALDNIFDPNDTLFDRYNNILTHLKLKLEEAYAKEIRKVRQEAQQLFAQYTPNRTLSPEHESLFSDWIWFDKTDSDDNTFGFHYLQAQGTSLDISLASALSALTISHLSVYEALDMEGEFLKVRDIFTGLEVKVVLKEALESVENLLLLGRLVHLPEGSIFSGMVLIMENVHERKDFLINHFNYLKEITADSDANIFKFQGHMIFGLFDHAYKKVMVNLNDIRYAPINPDKYKLLAAYFNNNNKFDKLYHMEDYDWFKPENHDRGYVKIALNHDNLIICADVIKDVSELQGEVNSLVDNLEFAVVNSNFLNKPPQAEEIDIWFTIIKDQEADKWFKAPIQDLEEKTPSELLEAADGKNRLLNLLNTLENADNTPEQNEFLEYLKDRVNLA